MTDRSLAVRGLLTSARRVLGTATRLAVARVKGLPSPRLQRIATDTLREVALRWPRLASLVTLVAPAEGSGSSGEAGSREAPPEEAHRPAPRSAETRKENLDLLRHAADFTDRARAAQALGDIVDAETTTALARALRDASSEVAVQAAESLARHGGYVAVTALKGVLENSDGYARTETRASAVRALGSILPPNEGTSVVAAVADTDATVSLAAIAALAERDEAESVQTLMGVLEDRADFYLPLTRHAAAHALSRLHRYDSTRMRALVERETDPAVRAVLESLGS